MPTTSNFGWTTPADTDLVKDGAAAIRTLGNGIDTSLVDLKGGTTGQVLAKASNTDLDFTWASDATGIPATILDAKGDLIAASAADTAARLAVGANNTVLTADSTTATGLKWATPSSGSMTDLATGSLSTQTTTISNISGAYKDLRIYLYDVDNDTGTAGNIQLRFNNDTNANYYIVEIDSRTGTVQGTGQGGDAGVTVIRTLNTAAVEAAVVCTIFDYAGTTAYKPINYQSIGLAPASTAFITGFIGGGGYASTTAITSVSIRGETNRTLTGTYKIVGVN